MPEAEQFFGLGHGLDAGRNNKRAGLAEADVVDREQTQEANGTLKFQLDLSGQKRYIKLVPKLVLTGGTTPSAALAGSALVLGDADELPVIPC